MQRLISFCIFFLLVLAISAQNYLFKDGKTEYDILLSADASVSEKTAAKELSDYVKQISGATLQVKTAQPFSFGGKHIYVGWTAKTGAAKPADADESFTYQTIGNDLYIWGGKNRGTMYGVFSFLEQQFGVHWYTPDFTKVPNMKYWSIPVLNHHESPAILHRLNYYYSAMHDDVWCAHNRLSDQCNTRRNSHGGLSAYWGMHTFNLLISPDKYFKSHPEYFAYRNGRRISNGQLCLSNQQMRKQLVANLLNYIKGEPDFWVYDVSQNDNNEYCECSVCKKLAAKYGGQSGLMIWMVNQIAEDVERVYPEKMVGTFAYHYSRQAPAGIKPRHNVVVRLCNIECCRGHAMDECPNNVDFMKDLRQWHNITENVYVWDYVVDYNQYLAAYPNIRTFGRNIKAFADNGAIGVMAEGQYETEWGEFSEMKQWMLAQLMWNPKQDIDNLAHQFIYDFYGSAASYVYDFYILTQNLVKPDTHFVCYIGAFDKVYTDQYIEKSMKLMADASKACQNSPKIRKRVSRVAAQVYYLRIRRKGVECVKDGTYRRFFQILDNDKTCIKEGNYSTIQLRNELRLE